MKKQVLTESEVRNYLNAKSSNDSEIKEIVFPCHVYEDICVARVEVKVPYPSYSENKGKYMFRSIAYAIWKDNTYCIKNYEISRERPLNFVCIGPIKEVRINGCKLETNSTPSIDLYCFEGYLSGRYQEVFKLPPQGWVTENHIVLKTSKGKRKGYIHNRLSVIRGIFPNLVKVSIRSKKVIFYYSPTVTKTIVEELKNLKTSPVGWFSQAQTCEVLKCPRETFKGIVDKYRPVYPEYFGYFFNMHCILREYYYKSLVEEMKLERKNGLISHEVREWMSEETLILLLGTGDKRIGKILLREAKHEIGNKVISHGLKVFVDRASNKIRFYYRLKVMAQILKRGRELRKFYTRYN